MNINKFAQRMQGAGVKPSLFEVQGPIGSVQLSEVPFLVKAASLPGSALGVIEIPYRGRRLKVPGNRTFADWTITIINDGKFKIRNAFETWVNSIQTMETNIAIGGDPQILLPPVFCDWQVNQLDRTGAVLKSDKLIGCFPTDISAIDLSYEANDQIEEFTVTLAYSYFSSNEGTPDVQTKPDNKVLTT